MKQIKKICAILLSVALVIGLIPLASGNTSTRAAAGNCGKGEGYIAGMSKNKSTVSVIAGQ